MKFNKVVVIYNPNSTGQSKLNAKTFKSELLEAGYPGEVLLEETKFAGHAEEIAEEYADPHTLIVSSSGDGGYNEVFNGMIRAHSSAVIAVLPSGNANDHHTANTTGELVGNIIKGKVVELEALRVDTTVNGKEWSRYAHSYVGFGLTPKVGKVLTEQRPNALTEKWYVLRHIFDFKYITLIRDGQKRRYSNLICAVITRMSKVVKLDEQASTEDGLMEIYETNHLTLIDTIRTLYHAAMRGIEHSSRVHALTLTTLRPTLIQLDGEVFTIDAKSDVTVTCEKALLKTVL
jgi:diacylglycerol kinase (ATP)